MTHNKVFFFLLFFSFSAFAQVRSRLAECQNSCSTRCLTLAEDLIQSGREIMERCGSSGGATDREIINRCTWHFGSNEKGAKCASRAQSVAVVDRCVWHFNATEKAINCVSARSSEVVDRCVWHFNSTDNGVLCASRGRSAQAIDACVFQFGTSAAGLACITGQ